MPVELIWDDEEHTIVRQTYTGLLSAEDFFECVRQNALMMAETSNPVDLILDISDAKIDLKGFFTAMRYANKITPANQRLTVNVGANETFQSMILYGASLGPKLIDNTRFASSLEEARQIIAAYRAELVKSI
ncbi:MAG: hypothetical protein ACOYL5_14165 [Phototrophicaceae bacterium]|jgi:tagatose-1,6-bisphosphate aldolase non-catalytic subunit AgaZ/GatZ